MKHTRAVRYATILVATVGLCAVAQAALPIIRINTQNGGAINSQTASRPGTNCSATNTYSHRYTAMSLTITGASKPEYNISVSSFADSIRGRGNSSYGQPKKPYRIKFDKKTSLFGKPAAKSWNLLSNWYDTTFTLNAVTFKLGRDIGLAFTPTSEFVELYLNDAYKGVYQLTEQVQVNPGRVDIDKKAGWLVEFDYHCPSDADEIDFNTDYPNNPSAAKLHTFIKSPEDLPNQSDYQFVKDEVNRLTDAMFKTPGFPTNGYRDLVNLESYAKYILIQQLVDNFDFNSKTQSGGLPGSNFAYKNVGGKIHAGPLWDFDLAMGVENPGMNMMNWPVHYKYYTDPIMPRHEFYKKFFEDKVFLAKFKKVWDNNQNVFNSIPAFIDSIATALQSSVTKSYNVETCTGGMWGMPTTCNQTSLTPPNLDTYNRLIATEKTWWNNRLNFFRQEINNMNIDISQDIPDDQPIIPPPPPPTSIIPSANLAHGKSVRAVKNGVVLNVAKSASVKVFNLNGREVRSATFSGGIHSIRIGDLPNGLYMVRTAVDGEKLTVRIAVR